MRKLTKACAGAKYHRVLWFSASACNGVVIMVPGAYGEQYGAAARRQRRI